MDDGTKLVPWGSRTGHLGSCVYALLRKTEVCDLWTELLPLCGIFPVSRAAQETKNAFILWKGIGGRG